MGKKLVYGVGVNDADYPVSPRVVGGRATCPFYAKWHGMIKRCYSEVYHAKKPTYSECIVCDEWLIFSNFKKWMEHQDWQGKQLDKDLLFRDNKVYSPDKCCFVTERTNSFLTDCAAARHVNLIGSHYNTRDGVFTAQCRNPFTLERERLGTFNDAQSAHEAWRKRKCEFAIMLAETESDPEVKAALTSRYDQ